MLSCLILTPLPWRVSLAFPFLWWLLWLQHCWWNSRFYRVSTPPAVPPHPGCFIHKTWTSPPVRPLFAFIQKTLAFIFLQAADEVQRNAQKIFIFSFGRLNELLCYSLLSSRELCSRPRMLSLLQRPHQAGSWSPQRKMAWIHRISHVGKAPSKTTSHGCEQPPLLLY